MPAQQRQKISAPKRYCENPSPFCSETAEIPDKWSLTHSKLKKLKKTGGCYLSLRQEQCAGLYALALLNYAIKEGDITIEDSSNGFRSVTEEEFGQYIARELKAGTYDFLESLKIYLKNFFQKTS